MEIVFDAGALAAAGFAGRDEIEDPLELALQQSGLAEITGGGGGSRVPIIDVEVFQEESFDRVLALLETELTRLGAPSGTRIIRHGGAADLTYRLD